MARDRGAGSHQRLVDAGRSRTLRLACRGDMAELVDAHDLKSWEAIRPGSTPGVPTLLASLARLSTRGDDRDPPPVGAHRKILARCPGNASCRDAFILRSRRSL